MNPAVRLPGFAPLMLLGALAVLGLLIVLPLGVVFQQALSQGLGRYLEPLTHPDSLAATRLTLLVAAISVPLNAVFGVAAAWAIARFEFRGKSLLVTFIDLPLSMSPVVSGLVWAAVRRPGLVRPLAHGAQRQDHLRHLGPGAGYGAGDAALRGPRTDPADAGPGADEEAALSLGANGWQTFFRVTLPNIRWGLLYGVLLTNARAMGEFGAVSVVSGSIRGQTTTLPLHVEVLYNDYEFVGAFAAASVLAGLGLVTLVLKSFLEWRHSGELSASRRH